MAEKAAAKGMTFEKALDRLEVIVREMESGDLSLENMMARFEEGTRLTAYCTARLNEVEKKIELLVQKGEKLATEPFAPDSAPDGERGG